MTIFIKTAGQRPKDLKHEKNKIPLNSRWRIIPGSGKNIGNYVYIDDVVKGHILAIEKGLPGEKYILGGENVSYSGFFKTLKKVSQK